MTDERFIVLVTDKVSGAGLEPFAEDPRFEIVQVDDFGDALAHVHCDYSEADWALLERSRELVRDLYARVGAVDIREPQSTFARDLQGSCRMGINPRTSVVDPDCRVHESPNLYVCGSEVFVTGGAMQPTLSIVAFAFRLAEHLVGRLNQGSVQAV